jgi:site-specific DNA recombinase
MGIVRYRCEEYAGRHTPLVTPEIFETVQRLLRAKNLAGERSRRHSHYLKGSVICARCGHRLGIGEYKGRGGAYDYFYCLGRHRNPSSCDLPYLRREQVEAVVEDEWKTVQLSEETEGDVRQGLIADLIREREGAASKIGAVQKRLASIERQRRVWAEKIGNGSIPDDVGREKQSRLSRELLKAQHDLAQLTASADDFSQVVIDTLSITTNCHTAYMQADDALRREWVQVFFEYIKVDVDRVAERQLRRPFNHLLGPVVRSAYQRPRTEPTGSQACDRAPELAGSPVTDRELVPLGAGLSNDLLVETMGFEPTTPALQRRCSSQLSYVPGAWTA